MGVNVETENYQAFQPVIRLPRANKNATYAAAPHKIPMLEGREKRSARWPVSRVLSLQAGDDHSSGPAVTDGFVRPTRTATRKRAMCHPYLVLLPVGLAVPLPLPVARCALAAPFHPYLFPFGNKAVCSLWRCPWGRPRRELPGTVFPWSPDFPRPTLRQSAVIRPSGLSEMRWRGRNVKPIGKPVRRQCARIPHPIARRCMTRGTGAGRRR